MRKNCFLITLFFCLFSAGIQAQAVEQGNILIDIDAGGPNLLTGAMKLLARNATATEVTNIQSSGLIPLGGRAEYLLTDNLGIGLDFNYASSKLSFTDIDNVNYSVNVPRFRTLLRGSYHFGKGDNTDWFLTGGVGYVGLRTRISGTSSNPDTQSLLDAISQSSKRIGFGFAYRLGIGFRWFFIKNLGIGMEAGLGGPALRGGLSLKF
ncbi:MAG: porin family protein [Bacteroidia bacterium]|nr:porin family protein [Bacteroidia bacterium]